MTTGAKNRSEISLSQIQKYLIIFLTRVNCTRATLSATESTQTAQHKDCEADEDRNENIHCRIFLFNFSKTLVLCFSRLFDNKSLSHHFALLQETVLYASESCLFTSLHYFLIKRENL